MFNQSYQVKRTLQIINPNEEAITLPKYSSITSISDVYVNSVQEMSDLKSQDKQSRPIGNINTTESKNKSKIEFDHSDSDLNIDQKDKLKKCLNKNKDIFSSDLSELGITNFGYHKIETENHIPIRLPLYRAAPTIKAEIEKQVEQMRESTIIKPSTSLWNSPVVMVKKKDG